MTASLVTIECSRPGDPYFRPDCARCGHPMDPHFGDGADAGCHHTTNCQCTGYRYPWEENT